MTNKRGFTLIEVLLAVMIVGLIGVALAALTTAAVRESGVGRTRLVLRNQLSLALRQLRQDIHQSTSASAHGKGSGEGSTLLTLYQKDNGSSGADVKLGPDHVPGTITYTYDESKGLIYRTDSQGSKPILAHVKNIEGNNGFKSPEFLFVDPESPVRSVLRVRIIVEVTANPVVNDAIDETFVLPQGFGIRQEN